MSAVLGHHQARRHHENRAANDLSINEPRPFLTTADGDDMACEQLDAGMGLRTLIHMDDPQHRVVRSTKAHRDRRHLDTGGADRTRRIGVPLVRLRKP